MAAVVTEPSTTSPANDSGASRAPTMADPMPIAFALFAFSLGVFFVRFVSVGPASIASGSTTEALNYALIVGGAAEVLAGVLGIIRGIGYPAYVTTTFGLWLVGLFLLVTSGAANKAFTPDALGWYALVLIVPVAILAVPAFVHHNVLFAIAFIALIVVLLFFGLGYHLLYNDIVTATVHKLPPNVNTAVDFVKVSAWAALVAAASIWGVFAIEVYRNTGVLRAGTSKNA